MASDAEIVRYAAPWPGTAARLLEGLAALGPGIWSVEQICRASASGTELGHAAEVLAGLAASGVCANLADDDTWECGLAPAELLRLSQILTGADHYRRMRINPAMTEFAITMPLLPSFLEKELETSFGRVGGFLTTRDAFSRVAQAAVHRLIVMSPFIDLGGFRWLRRVFEAAPLSCEKVLILRDASRYAVERSVEHKDWLQRLSVSVRDYYLSHDANAGRALPVETFHAKLLLADNALAYIGSANLLSSSEGVCLETGFLVEGAAAGDVARLVEAVLHVAKPL